jgi:hypothetical protein
MRYSKILAADLILEKDNPEMGKHHERRGK